MPACDANSLTIVASDPASLSLRLCGEDESCKVVLGRPVPGLGATEGVGWGEKGENNRARLVGEVL